MIIAFWQLTIEVWYLGLGNVSVCALDQCLGRNRCSLKLGNVRRD